MSFTRKSSSVNLQVKRVSRPGKYVFDVGELYEDAR